MSDFFIQNQEETQQNNNTNIQTTTPQVTSNFGDINANVESFKQKKREHYVNAEEYGVELPDGYYDAFRPILENCKTQEERQEMAYKLGTAAKYAELTGEPFLDCWQNVDALSKANFPNLQNQKGIFEATRDMITVGQNNVKLGNLGQQLMKAHRENDEELAASLMAEIDAINQSNAVLQEHIPDRWWKEAVEAGASSIPFTGYVAGAGIIGNFLTPLVGTTAATATSSYLAGGQEYIDMIANGSTPETARIVSNVSGIFQGLIEADLGITGGLVKGSAKLMGKEAAEKAAKKTIEEIGRKAFKRFHFGPVKTLVANFAMNYAENVVGEGVEEAAQNIVSVAGKELAAILDGYDLPDDDIKSIVTETMDQFKGGMLGAVFLGAAPAGLNAAADIKNYADVRKKSEAVASKEAFYNEVKDNPIFEGMSEQNKRRTSDDIWEKGQQRLEERANAEAKKIAEVQDAAEGSEELKTGEEEGEETEATPVTRDEETGRLFTQDKVNTDDNGNVTGGTFLVGNRNEENANRYGYINWEYADGDQSKIIINDFKMGKGREGIRAEAFNDFAIQHPGVEIEWNTKGSEAAAVKEMLAENNPSGKKNGLNYYADENAVADASTRAWVSKQLDEHISSIEVVDNKAIKTKLTNAQKAAGVALLEAAAKRNGMSLTEYVNKTFGNEIFGDQAELQKAALRQAAQDIKEGKKVTKKAGGVDVGIAQQEWKKYGQQIKAVIYAGENADFSTWTHELAHIFQNQLDGDLKTQAEQAFNVVNGDWQNSQYTFKDGTVMPAAEAFAYGFQDWLKTGKAENEQMKNIFQKFAEFVARAYNSLKDFINLTPEITSVYEQLLAGDDSMLKAAEMAVEAEDRRYRAQMQQEAKQAEETKKAEAEQQQKAEEAEREEASETTEYEEEKEELTPEAAEEKLQEVTNETEKTANPIDNALEDTNLTDNQKDQIAETLKDDTATVTEKAEAATDAASSAYVPYDLFQTEAGRIMQYQLAGEPSIRRMAEGEEKRRIILNLVTAKDMERNGTDARTIREVTGWEKDSRNEWKYETNDSLNMIRNSGSIEKFLNKNPDYLIDTYSQMRFNLPEVVTSPQLYEVFPFLRNIRVSFYKAADGLRSRLNEHGIMLNTYTLNKVNGPASIKASIAYEIQKLIYATEHTQDRQGFNRIIQGYKDEAQQITDEMNQAIRDVGNGNDYDKETIERHLIEYRKTDANIDAQMVASRILLNADERSKKTLADSKAEIDKDIADAEARLNRVQFQKVTDPELLEKLNSEPTIKVYRAMQVIDGKYYPPMATVVNGKRVDAAEAGDWIQADENPELAIPDIDPKTKQQKVDKDGNLKWKFVLDKGGKDSSGKALTKIPAAYNPYWHTSRSPLNDQFSSAYKRPNLVTVEVEVPESELTSGYKAERAKDAVGEMDWHSGPVSSQLAEVGKPRKVILSRYCKIDRVIPDSEVAKTIKDMLEGTDIAIPDNTITPSLKAELEKIGVKVEETEDVRDYNKDLEEASKKAQELLFQNELTMYGIHNLSEEALRHAIKMGGLANPSMAVVDTEKNSFTNFGDISLIPYNYMLEKGEGSKGTFGADIYSPRYPDIKKTVTPTGEKKINALFHGIEDQELKTHLTSQLINKIEESTRNFDYAYSPLSMAYLADKGNTDFIKRKAFKYSEELRNKVKELGNDYKDHEKEWTDLYKEWRKDELKEQFKDKNIPEDEFNKIYDALIKQVIDPETGYLHWGSGTDFVYNIFADVRDAGKLDYYATERAARELVENDPDFEKWAKEAYDRIEKEEKIFNGFTPSGNRRYLAHTLENVSKYMRQQELQGGESFYYGLGSTRAKFTPQFKTLNQIKKARDRLVTHEEFEKIKEEYNERFDNIIEELRGDNDFDTGAARFEEAFTYGKNDPIGYLEREYKDYGVHMTEDLAKEILDFATALRQMPTEYFETKYTRPVMLNEFAGAIIPSNISQDLKDTLAENGLMIEEYDSEAGNREEVTKAALQKFNETRRVLFQEEDIQQQVNQLMTMEKAKDMIQRTFVLANIKDWYDGEYANGDEWLKDRGVDEVAMYVDNEWQIQEKFLNNIPALMDGDFTSADIIEAYLNGTLTGPQQQNKEALKPIDTSKDTGFKDDRFYAPRRIDTDAKELLEKASVKVTDANRKEVYKARADFITAAHETGFAASLGMTQAALNKKIMSWAAYPANAAKVSNSINRGVALQNKWTGIENSNLLKLFSIEKEQLMSMVKDVTGNPSEYQLAYVTSVILALDTHIDFSGLTYEFNAHIEKDSTMGQYNSNEKKIQIKRDSINTIAHETGHALDHLWGREILGHDDYLTTRVRMAVNSDKITDPDVKSFLQHFADFLESIENVSDLHNEYTMDSKEVFARFVARFTEWTRNVATNNRFGFEDRWYKDNFTTQQYYDFAHILQEKSALDTKTRLQFQEVYHGSGADFDKFDTENFGLSGEGSMSFGYGTYFTDSEDIARDYADRAGKVNYHYFYKGKEEIGAWNPKTLASAMYNHYGSIEEAIKNLEEFKAKSDESLHKAYYQSGINILKESKPEDFKTEIETTRHLYTVEIPDDGYLEWNEHISKEDTKKIVEKFVDFMLAQPSKNETKIHEVEDVDSWYWDDITGHGLYETLEVASSNRPQLVSQFLHSIGYAGIKYPAGTIHGNGNGAYNYVIFNDDDAKIVDKMLFQTQAELQDEALTFESWQDFMEFCETFHTDDEVSPIPYNADAQWYQTFWETAKGVETEQEKNEEAVTEKVKKEGALPGAVDALFATYIRTNPEMVDSFLKAVADIDAMDLDSEEWQHVEDEEGAKQRERYDQLKDYIDITLSDYNWQTAIKRVQGGHEIAEGLRKRLIGEMLDNFKIRDFRDIYSQIMDDPQFAVDEADSTTAQLNKKLSKYKKFDILKPNEDISRVSPERRKRIAEALQNKEIAEKIRNGSLKLDDEIEAYLKSLDKQVKDLQKDYNELEKETKNDYQRLADAERRKLLKLHEELLLARGKLKTRDAETDRKINKGLKITEKYQKASQNMTANYDELFRKFTDLKNTMQITAEVQAALDRQEQVAGLKENLNNKQKEKNLIAEVKKMRIQLVKRAMRRVPFNRIDYENARTVIAIQRMLEPNLMGGVNRFIGIDSAFLRGVISGIVTDSDYKAKILNYLRKQDKSSQAFVDFLKKVEDLKSIKDFDSWTAKERKYAIKHLPKENWVKDLNLQQLAKEREESIDLDIGMKEKKIQRVDPKTGRAMTDKEGNPIYETTFVLDAADELKKLVRDAVGADMYDLIIDKPFAEWTTEELERLAQRIDELYTEGRDLYAAKLEARKRENDAIRKRVEDAIKETGITINDDDTPEEKERKAEKIAKILNQKSGLKGTEAGKNSGIKAKFDRLIHGYADANVLRVARILDNYSEGENVRLLYRREDECFNNKTRSIMRRGETVKKVMADNKITEGSLAEVVKVPQLGTQFTVDELLYFLAADKDYEIDEKKAARPDAGPLDMNDDYAATSRNAVMFGNMMSDNASQEQKEQWAQMDREMQDAIENDTLTQEQKEALALGQLDRKPGTTMFINTCKAKWEICLSAANNFLKEHPEYNALLEAIEADYAEQYERMNEISITEFNTPVHRVRAYVPLVRRESNGDTNVNQVKEDLLGAYGGEAGKQWVNKGMTQRRVNISPLKQQPVQTGLFRTWADSIDRTEHFIAYAPYVRQLNAVYKSRDASYTRRFIEARYGKPMMEYIDSYINEVANPNANKVRERGAEFLHILRGKTAPAYLGWKFSGIVKQGLTSPWPYMQFVNPAEYLAAATKCWTTGGKYYDAIKEKSAYMASRVMDPINELVDEMADNAKSKVDRAWSNFAKKGMAGLEWIDWTCVAPGWLACYEKEYNRLQNMSEAKYQEKIAELTEKNMTAEVGTSEWMSREQIEQTAKQELMDDIESAAVTYADDCTRACQPSSRLTDLAPLFKNSSEAMKAFLQFQTSLNVIWQNIRYDIPYNIRQKEFKKIVGTVCGYVLAGIFMNSVMDGVKGDDDDDDMQALRNLLFYSTTQFTDAIPMIGSDITNMMDQVITGKRGFAQSGTDMTPSATKLMSALQKATNGDFKKAASLAAEGIGLGLGAPVSGTKEIYKLLGKPLSEGDVNIARGVSDVYGIAGDIIGE